MKVYLVIERTDEETSVKAYGSYKSAARAMKGMVVNLTNELTEADYDVDAKLRGDNAYVETWSQLTEFRIEEKEVLA